MSSTQSHNLITEKEKALSIGDSSKQPFEDHQPSDDPETYPEGGWQGWTTLLGAVLIQFCGFGYTTSFGVYQDFYTRIYITNQSSSAISWIGSVNAFIVIASGLLAGRMYDRGYFYYLLYGGSFLTSFSLFMLSLAKPNNIYQCFLAQGVGMGLGAGMVYVPSVAVVSHYFYKRRAFAMMVVVSGSSIGAIVHPIMLNNLINGPFGFEKTVRASAGLVSGLLLIACLLMRQRLPPPAVLPNIGEMMVRYSRDWPYITMSTALTIFTVGFYFPLFYLQLDSVKHGLGEHFSFYALVIMNAASLVGRLIPGLFVDSIGVINMVTISSACCAVLIFAMLALKSLASVIVIGILFGFFAGMFIGLQAPLVAVLTSDFSELGARMGIAFTFCAFGALIGPPIHGALLTDQFIWWRPAVLSGIFAIVGAAGFASIPWLLKASCTRT